MNSAIAHQFSRKGWRNHRYVSRGTWALLFGIVITFVYVVGCLFNAVICFLAVANRCPPLQRLRTS